MNMWSPIVQLWDALVMIGNILFLMHHQSNDNVIFIAFARAVQFLQERPCCATIRHKLKKKKTAQVA